MDQLHSKKDNELEAKDQRIFSRVIIMAGITLLLLLAMALLFVHFAGNHVHGIIPASHPLN